MTWLRRNLNRENSVVDLPRLLYAWARWAVADPNRRRHLTVRLVLRSASAIRASKSMHEGMAKGLLHSPLSFFHKTPTGRITSRFGTDLEDLDSVLHYDLCEFAGNSISAISTINVCAAASPRFLLIVPLVLFIFSRIQKCWCASHTHALSSFACFIQSN